MTVDNNHTRYFFRILRPDENIHNLRAKDPEKESPRNDDDVRQSIQEHIKSGSSGYRSPWISTTGELYVALAFSSVISQVAKMSTHELHKEKTPEEIICLDKSYLRSVLSEDDAVLRSKRSDEVLIFKNIKCAELLEKNIQKVDRLLHPDFLNDDGKIFPFITKETSIKSIEMLAGPNKGLFRISVDGKPWLARLPRPNFDLEKDVLYDDKLVQLCKHQFTIYSAYRSLGAPVPKCALYTFQVSIDLVKEPYKTALLLMEDMEPCKDHEKAKLTALKMFPMDLLLGNWDPIEGVNEVRKLVADNLGAFFTTIDGEVVRLSLDRTLGCVYPEDRTKPDKHIIEFEGETLGLLKKTLQDAHAWCYGCISHTQFIQMSMEMIGNCDWAKLKTILTLSQGLPWIEKEKEEDSISNIIEARKNVLKAFLPYHEIIPLSECIPDARDGHGAISLCRNGVDRKMFICGGNSEHGPLNDLWQFDFITKEWTEMENMPCHGRYSFSMHLFNERYIIVYGGCTKGARKMQVKEDILFYDIQKNKWTIFDSGGNNQNGNGRPKARCRQGSYLKNIDENQAEMIVVGGSDNNNKKCNDVWKLHIETSEDSDDLSFVWQKEPNLNQRTHRCFLFAHQSSYYLLGGFGRNLRKLEEINGNKKIVVTRTSELPASEKESFVESKSLAGFGAVYDGIEERVILIGGGNVVKRDNASGSHVKTNKAFGDVPNDREVKSYPRILILKYGRNSEWFWKNEEHYCSLEDKYKLPNLLHWSLVYVGHSVILFGGRLNDDWSNKMYQIDLHPELKTDLKQTAEDFQILKEKLTKRCKKHNGKKLDTLQNHIQEETQELKKSF